MEVKGVDECMLKEYLEKTYGRNEPIFINEIRLEGVNAKPVPGKVASQNRGFYTKDFYPDYLFGDGDHAGLNNTIHTDAGISICIWQVEDLPLFQHGIFTAGYQTPAVIIKTLDNKINFTAKHISKNLILPL